MTLFLPTLNTHEISVFYKLNIDLFNELSPIRFEVTLERSSVLADGCHELVLILCNTIHRFFLKVLDIRIRCDPRFWTGIQKRQRHRRFVNRILRVLADMVFTTNPLEAEINERLKHHSTSLGKLQLQYTKLFCSYFETNHLLSIFTIKFVLIQIFGRASRETPPFKVQISKKFYFPE